MTRKYSRLFVFVSVTFIFGCGNKVSIAPDDSYLHEDISVFEDGVTHIFDEPSKVSKYITIADLKYPINAKIDPFKHLITLDYPVKMVSSLKLIGYHGYDAEENPFSEEHCKEIRKEVESGLYQFVRTNYYSTIAFEVPPFLNIGFFNKAAKAAIKAGEPGFSFSLNNSIDFMKSYMAFQWSDRSLAFQIGAIEEAHFNLGLNGRHTNDYNKELILTSGDILCDLASGDLKLTMMYVVKGLDKPLELSFGKLQLLPE
jgi:hypothetical protein